MPLVIKRYPNRKLYNTQTKKYITLDGIAELIRQGDEIQVIDNENGDDITALTLTQVIYEQEKKQSGFFPHTVLTDLIRSSGDTFGSFQRAISASVNYWHQIDEEIRLRIQKLVKQGEITELEGVNLLNKLLKQGKERLDGSQSAEELQKILDEKQIPTRQDLDVLMRQLDELAIKLEEITDDSDERNP